jgi:hypothetical protein
VLHVTTDNGYVFRYEDRELSGRDATPLVSAIRSLSILAHGEHLLRILRVRLGNERYQQVIPSLSIDSPPCDRRHESKRLALLNVIHCGRRCHYLHRSSICWHKKSPSITPQCQVHLSFCSRIHYCGWTHHTERILTSWYHLSNRRYSDIRQDTNGFFLQPCDITMDDNIFESARNEYATTIPLIIPRRWSLSVQIDDHGNIQAQAILLGHQQGETPLADSLVNLFSSRHSRSEI